MSLKRSLSKKMKIGVISDTHRYTSIISKAIEVFDKPDLIIHLGDNVQDICSIEKFYKGRIINVRGNCDFSTDVPEERIEDIAGKRFFITHGHRYDVKYDILRIKYRAMELNADVVLFGHSHVSMIDYDEGIWFINPGSPSYPRDGSRSVAVIKIENERINASIKEI